MAERMAYCRTTATSLALLCIVAQWGIVHATSYVVGDSTGWDFEVSNWPNGKSFKSGDVLVFNYVPELHNVVVVDKEGYETCTVTEASKIFSSGHDHIKLNKGGNYFICGIPGHCLGFGMRIAVNAA